ncbi:hypothetical protein [Chthonobacter albigriseus]|uniref:hypothetical protein n=1 Tax=Chthonobacter albigriseus TaxID=1683161 RepID=UPI0015EF0E4D|nr:hypothetical protein [Chthonobacter albigriseus]
MVAATSFRSGGRWSRGDRLTGEQVFSSDDILFQNTGEEDSPAEWSRKQARRKRILDASHTWAELLEKAGLEVRTESKLTEYGILTGHHRRVEAYRAVNMLPVIAQRERAPLGLAAQYFCDKLLPRGSAVAQLVVTAGPPTPVSGLREASGDLHRLLSRLAPEMKKRFGVCVLLRSTHCPSSKDRPAGTTVEHLVHLHAHVLLQVCQADAEDEVWCLGVQEWCRRFLKAAVAGPRLEADPAAAVRYVLKPDWMGPPPSCPKTALALFEATGRLKFAQPMGDLAKFLRELRQAGEAIVGLRRDGKVELVRQLRSRRSPANGNCSNAAGRRPPRTNVVVAVTNPRASFSRRYEPVAIVRNFDETTIDPSRIIDPWTLSILRDVFERKADARRSRRGSPNGASVADPRFKRPRFDPKHLVHPGRSTVRGNDDRQSQAGDGGLGRRCRAASVVASDTLNTSIAARRSYPAPPRSKQKRIQQIAPSSPVSASGEGTEV